MNYDTTKHGYWFSADQLAEHDKQIRNDLSEIQEKAYQQGRADQLKEDCEITINLKGGVLAEHDKQIRNEERERIIKELEVYSKYCLEIEDSIEYYTAVINCIQIVKGGAENE